MSDEPQSKALAQKSISAPESIKLHHRLEDFDCENESLNAFLKKRAIRNEGRASRTYIVTDGNYNAIGYYTLAVGSIEHKNVRRKAKQNMPDPIPVTVLGRLAVDKGWKEKGIGQGMLKEALLKTLEVAEVVGVRGMLVHAISENAKNFYTSQGFEQSPTDEMTLIITIEDIKKAFTST